MSEIVREGTNPDNSLGHYTGPFIEENLPAVVVAAKVTGVQCEITRPEQDTFVALGTAVGRGDAIVTLTQRAPGGTLEKFWLDYGARIRDENQPSEDEKAAWLREGLKEELSTDERWGPSYGRSYDTEM